ncbi:MAG: class I SAM-dependent methyltransferase [Oligoflexia bacterium]|nr:class I SAM-dependent methyltransferase [Oligoflexia bacterium]
MSLLYEDISPKALELGHETAIAIDLKALQKRKAEFVKVPCPACAFDKYTLAYIKYEMTFVICDNCKTQYISPRPTPEILKAHYTNSANYEYWAKYFFPMTAVTRKEKIFAPRAKLVSEISKRYNVGSELLIEVGSGFGFFCEKMKELNVFKKIIGIEPTPHLAQICREQGIEVIESVIEDIKFYSAADVVVSFEVIEHLFEPKAFLENCYNILKPNGFIVLTCPNINGFETQMLGRFSDSVDYEHLNYFLPESLSLLVSRVGFEVVEVKTPGVLDCDIVASRLLDKKKESIVVDPFIKRILLDESRDVRDGFQNFLTASGLSSNMMIIARKPN